MNAAPSRQSDDCVRRGGRLPKKALVDVGLWDRDMITEDIAVSWKLQKRFWDIRYEPRALCWMLVPETLSGTWNQRVRWAQGGQEVVLRHWDVLAAPHLAHLYRTVDQHDMGILLALCHGSSAAVCGRFREMLIWFTLTSFTLVLVSMIQLLIALRVDSRYNL